MSAREPSTRQLVTRGVAATAVIALVAIAAACNPFAGDGNIAELSIVAPAMPDGVQKGTPVDMRGETVGEVCKVDNSQAGSTRIGLCIDSTAMAALTPDTAASFVSRNLFGSDALRLIPTPDGQHLGEGATLMLTQPPADYTITAAVRSAGAFTLPVLTPKLTELLNEASDVAIRMAPFLTAGLVAMQTMERGNVTALTRQMPMIADALDGVGQAGAGAVGALETIIGNKLLEDTVYTAKVASMIADIGGLFTDLGALFNGMSGLGATMDLMTAFTTPLTHSLQGVTPAEVNQLIRRFGGAFHTDERTGRTTLAVQVNLEMVPAVATPLSQLLAGKEARRAHPR